MRLTTAAAIGIVAFSGMAIAQVASSPVEQKTAPADPAASTNNTALPDNTTAAPDPATSNQTVDDALANTTGTPEVPSPR